MRRPASSSRAGSMETPVELCERRRVCLRGFSPRAGTRSSLGTGSGERENRLALQDRLQNRLLRYPIFLLSRASILLQSKASTSSADFCAFSVALRGHGHSTAQLRRVLVMLETTPVLIDLPCPKEDEFCHHSAEVILVLPNAAV